MAKQILIDLLPWLLSANTLYVMFLAGSKNKYAWLLALIGQIIWMVLDACRNAL